MIDICMTTYNSLNWLRIFTDYLFANTKDFKLYVSDSGSTDGSYKYLEKLKDKYPDIVTIRHTEDNSGEAKGINWGASLGSSPYILWCSPDIILPEMWFEKMSAHFQGNVGAVGPISDMVSGRQQLAYSYGQYEDDVDLLIGFCMLIKREVWAKTGRIDEELFYSHGDNEFSIKVKKAGYRLVIARDVFVKHFCYRSASAIGLSKPDIIAKEKQHVIEKHGQEYFNATVNIKPTVTVGIPFSGDVDTDFLSSIVSMQQPGGTGSVVFAKTIRTLIMPSRNLLAQAAIDNNSQFLLFIDSDMVFGAQSLMRLLSRACDKNVSIVGGLCYKRRPNFEQCIMNRNGSKWKYAVVPEVNGLYEIDGIGMAFTLIRTEVFRDLKKPYFYADKEGLREDLNFCWDAKKAGHRVFVDTTVQVGHLGERVVIDHSFVKTKIFKEA